MNLCAPCSALYHGQSANPASNSGVASCEACGDALAPESGALRRHMVAIGACIGLLVILGAVGGRAAVVAVVPGAAPIFSALGLPVASNALEIVNVHAKLSTEGGKSLLVVEGELVNPGPRETAVPTLSVALVRADGGEIYSWRAHASKSRLSAGERLAFRTRLESPPADIGQALVKFAAVGDKVALTGDGR